MITLLGYKIGMTRIFDDSGRATPVTALRVDPCVVTQSKTVEKDGYKAVQIGSGATRHPKQPQSGHAKAAGSDVTPHHLREFRLEKASDAAEYTKGDVIDLSEVQPGSLVKIVGTSKGKGFAGVIKKHNFSRGPETHGSDHHRKPGSSGSMYPQHIFKGKRYPGKMGNKQISVRKVEIVAVYKEDNLLLVKGPVPGIRGALVEIVSL